MDFEGLANQLQLLHHFELRVQLDDHARAVDPEMRLVLLGGRDAQERCADSVGGRVEDRVTVPEFGRVLDHFHGVLAVARFVLHREHRNRLELAPAHGERNRVLILEDVRVPAVLLQLDTHKS